MSPFSPSMNLSLKLKQMEEQLPESLLSFPRSGQAGNTSNQKLLVGRHFPYSDDWPQVCMWHSKPDSIA